MNIFYLDHNQQKCAEYHCDRHTVKMIVEYAQLLSTAHRVLDGKAVEEKNAIGHRMIRYYLGDARDDILYKSTHINHPSAIWVRESRENYIWLYGLLVNLVNEYTYRYGKYHATGILLPYLATAPINIPDKPFTEPTPAMDTKYIIKNDSVSSYRKYYIEDKYPNEWFTYSKNRDIPNWLKAATEKE